jgi:hypothetical protein
MNYIYCIVYNAACGSIKSANSIILQRVYAFRFYPKAVEIKCTSCAKKFSVLGNLASTTLYLHPHVAALGAGNAPIVRANTNALSSCR